MVKNMFKQNLKIKKAKKQQKLINQVQNKNKAKQKKLWSVLSCRKNAMCTGKKNVEKVNISTYKTNTIMKEQNSQ